MNRGSEVKASKSPREIQADVLLMLENGKIDEAVTLFDRAFQRWPASAQLLLLKGEMLARMSGPAEAAAHFAALLKTERVAQWAAPRLLKVLREGQKPIAGAVDVAVEVCDAEIESKVKEQILDILVEQQGVPERLRLLELGASCGIPRYELKLAVARTESADFEAAVGILAAARRAGRISVPGSVLLSELLTLFSRLPEAIQVLEDLLDRYPDNPDIYRRLTHTLQRAREFERSADIFERAIRRWPHDWMLLVRLNRMPIEQERLERFFEIISDGAEDVPARNERFRFHFARTCLLVGKVARAMDLLGSPFEPAVEVLASPFRNALSARDAEHWVNSSRLVDDRTRDVQVTRAPKARATCILTINATFGSLPQSLVDTLFADHGLNAVYLRDFQKRNYLRGVAGLGRTEEETIAALRNLVAELGTNRTIVMGGSGGGFSALRYGALMAADTAVSFAGPTDASSTPLYHQSRPSAWNPDFFVRGILDRESDLPLDLMPVLSTPRHTHFIQYFGQEMAEDVRQARRIEGLPGVTLRPVPGLNSHYVLDHLIGDGSFDSLLEELAAS
jgi:tetratricopeptide (TPR) repeat protein